MDLTIVRSTSMLANSKIANHMFHICVSSLQQSHLQNSSMISGTYEQQPSKPSKTTWLVTLAKPRTTVTTATTAKTVETVNFDDALWWK